MKWIDYLIFLEHGLYSQIQYLKVDFLSKNNVRRPAFFDRVFQVSILAWAIALALAM